MSLPMQTPLQVEWGVHKVQNTINYHFQNINGLKWSKENLPLMIEGIKNTALHEFNIIALAETNTEWELDGKRPLKIFKNLLRSSHCNVSLNTSASSIKFHTEYKPGGTATIVCEPWHTRVLEQSSDRGHGRWSHTTVQVKGNKKLTFLTVYRVCEQSPTHLRTNNRVGAQDMRTCYSQQLEVYAQSGIMNKDPRKATTEDLKDLILKNFHTTDDYLLVGIDANESCQAKQNPSVFDMFSSLGLHDAIEHLNGEGRPATIKNSSLTIDYIYVSQNLLPHLVGAGQLKRDLTFISDHPALFVQLDSNSLLCTSTTSVIPMPRRLRTMDITCMEAYLGELRYQLSNNDIQNRVRDLFEMSTELWTDEHTAKYNRLDQHITAIMISAEKKCSNKKQGNHVWSPDLAAAGTELSYWLILKRSHKRQVSAETLEAYRLRAGLPTHSILAGKELNKEIRLARKRLESVRENAYEHRQSWLESLAISNDIARGKDPTRSRTLKQLISREEWRRRYRRCQELIGTNTGSGLREVHVPSNPEEEPSNSVQSWRSITSPPEMIKYIMSQNNVQFSQAKDTPLADTTLGRTIGKHGNSEAAEQILNGTFNTEHQINEVIRFIQKCKKDPRIQTFHQEVTLTMFKNAFSGLSEKKSSSNSGRHIGHYKAALECEIAMEIHCRMMSIPFKHGITPDRWTKVTDVMLEKNPGVPRLHRLRVIQLIEADLNQCLLILFTRPMVHTSDRHSLIHQSQWSTRNQNCTSAILSKTINLEYSRITKAPTGWIENDAKGCFDRIIPSIAVINCRRYGAPKNGCQTLAKIWNGLKHSIKTSHGISTSTYHAGPGEYHAGAGQGSCLAPLIWSTISTQILEITEEVPHRVTVLHANNLDSISSQSEAYVDDTSFMVNLVHQANRDPIEDSKVIAEQITKVSQIAEKTLYASGGALELSKCAWYSLTWKWDPKGVAHLQVNTDTPADVLLTSGGNLRDTVKIPRLNPNQASKTLGCYIAPNGSSTTQVQVLLKKAEQFKRVMTAPSVSKVDAYILYRVFFFPATSFPLGVSQISNKDLKKIESRYMTPTKRQLGFRKTSSNAIFYGPRSKGAFELPSLIEFQERQHLRMLCGHLRANDHVGKAIINTISMLQLESGLTMPFLNTPYKYSQWVTEGWLKECWRILDKYKLQIHSQHWWTPPTLREHDQGFMKTIADRGKFEAWQLRQINRCRMYLKITTISDIASPCGTKLHNLRVNQSPTPVEDSKFNWPTQECPEPRYWKIWRSAARILLDQNKDLSTPLGSWHAKPRQIFPWCIDSAEKKIYQVFPTHAMVHWRKHFHRNSSRGNKEYILRGRKIPLIEIPHNTNYVMIKTFPNKLQLLTNTPRPAFNLPHSEYRKEEMGENFTQAANPQSTEEELNGIHDALMTQGICIHIKALHEKHQIGLCYEILAPPNPTPKHWSLNLLPSHELDSTNTRSLQMSLASALHLIRKCEEKFNQTYRIALSPTAWKQYINNMHTYPTRGYSSLFKPGSDAFKVLESARCKVTSSLYELDTEDLLIEYQGKLFLPEYLERTLTPNEKRAVRENSSSRSPTTMDYPREAAFLIEHDHQIHGHIPETVFQASHKENYRLFLEKNMGITRAKDVTVAWDLLSDAINQLNLAKLVPVLKFINNEWATATKMHKYFNSNPKCPMCESEEDMEHVFSCNSANAKKTRHESLKSINKLLSKNNPDLAQWWCTMINTSFVALGALPIEDFLPTEQDLQFVQAQTELGPMNFLQGRIHKQISTEIGNKGLCTLTKPLAIHLLWKMAATIWRTRNQALHGTTKTERTYKLKTRLDQKMQHILKILQDNSIAHRPVPIGYSFTVDSKQAWIRWETLSLKNHDISTSNRPITSHATSTVNLGGTSQRSRLRSPTSPAEGQGTDQSMATIL